MPHFIRFFWLSFALLSPLTFASSEVKAKVAMANLAPHIIVLNQLALLQVAGNQFDAMTTFLDQHEPGFLDDQAVEILDAKADYLAQLEQQMPDNLAQTQPNARSIQQAQAFFKHAAGKAEFDVMQESLERLLPLWLMYQTQSVAPNASDLSAN
jgi:hypothetical protein